MAVVSMSLRCIRSENGVPLCRPHRAVMTTEVELEKLMTVDADGGGDGGEIGSPHLVMVGLKCWPRPGNAQHQRT